MPRLRDAEPHDRTAGHHSHARVPPPPPKRELSAGRGDALASRVSRSAIATSSRLAVEDAEDFIAVEFELFRIAGDLRITGRVAEAQVAVELVQRQQMRQDARSVSRRQRTDRNPAKAEPGFARWASPRAGVAIRFPGTRLPIEEWIHESCNQLVITLMLLKEPRGTLQLLGWRNAGNSAIAPCRCMLKSFPSTAGGRRGVTNVPAKTD